MLTTITCDSIFWKLDCSNSLLDPIRLHQKIDRSYILTIFKVILLYFVFAVKALTVHCKQIIMLPTTAF
ncbi:hypothetical protein T4A_13375 [Trichinella pseudospiralis]|uniref:Uncharacterized protein n=1 Tax=Trichinella pseudospiralis TaxID=6337 RepID=A0A0V1FRA4_TRIPS|nr:hypothetical protein T4A_13375 [Trichinella pseudospiralis]KRY88582.1 hypothetical protein T4D_1004 [Trichinella pseudospiralis]KRZ40852.1 hypothetical protein T4C_1052 [Trichinella pseudospiralis]